MNAMRILFIGDIVGRSGRAVVLAHLPGLIRDWKLDFVAINGENAAGGFGITEPIYHELIDAGAKLALPVVAGKGKPLTMRAWNFGEPLGAGVWGIREPKPEAAEVEPDILIVPLLAFDRSGHRIGYGAGYYDMTIAALRAKKPIVAVGIAFAAQEIETVPITPRDARLDLVLTEREVIDCRAT